MNTGMKSAVITGVFVAVLAAIGSGTWWLHKSRTVQLFGNFVPRVEVRDRLVALTFDDGPYPGYVDDVVAILERHDVRGTFFLVGSAIERYPEEARKLVDAGHEIGNHSYSHEPMVLKSLGFVRAEIERTDEVIRSLGYEGPIHFRAPYGKRLEAISGIIEELEGQGYRFVTVSELLDRAAIGTRESHGGRNGILVDIESDP